MPLILTQAELQNLARIVDSSAPGAVHETIAKHFLAVGLERAALRCDDLAALSRKELAPDEAVAKAFEIAAAAIRADELETKIAP